MNPTTFVDLPDYGEATMMSPADVTAQPTNTQNPAAPKRKKKRKAEARQNTGMPDTGALPKNVTPGADTNPAQPEDHEPSANPKMTDLADSLMDRVIAAQAVFEEVPDMANGNAKVAELAYTVFKSPLVAVGLTAVIAILSATKAVKALAAELEEDESDA